MTGSRPRPPPSQRPVSGPLAPVEQQIDLDGGLHDIAPQNERMRLFEPAPAQLQGQTFMQLDKATPQ